MLFLNGFIQFGNCTRNLELFLRKGDLHRVRRSNLEALKCLFRGTARKFGGEFDERNVVTIRHQTYLLESRELVEQHRQHHLVRLFREIGEEENLIRRLFRIAVGDHRGGIGVGGVLCLLVPVEENY